MIVVEAPKNPIHAKLHLSGSKSISNRLLILKAIFGSELQIHNISDSEDTTTLQLALKHIFQKTASNINVRHAGSDLRFLTAFLSVHPGEFILSGSERLQQRPIADLVNALRSIGAEINFTTKENFPPLFIKGKSLSGGKVEIKGNISSQFISALLLISPTLKDGITLHIHGDIVSKPYIEMTIQLLKDFGSTIIWSNNTIEVAPYHAKALPHAYEVESDWSSASYFYSMCALSSNASIQLSKLGLQSIQSDSILADLFKQLGVHTTFNEGSILLHSIPVTAKEFNFNCCDCPDIAQTLVVCCFGLGISCHLTGLSTLKIKETDRLLALKTELEKFGASVSIDTDSIQLLVKTEDKQKNSNTNQITIRTYNDHRMAMSFAPLALITGRIQIENPDVVSKSYPSFWHDLKSLGFNVNLQP